MDKKFLIDTIENKEYLSSLANELLRFGVRFPSKSGSSYYLGDDGSPWTNRPRETWITSRMTHVYSIGHLLGFSGAKELAKRGLDGLAFELRDKENGGWFQGLDCNDKPLDGKLCYAHAFVILASSSAYLAGVEGAKELLEDALKFFDERFYREDEGLAVNDYSTDFKVLNEYRGINANMHTVEAFLAVADALSDENYRERAGRIVKRVIAWAKENEWRIPEHFNSDWTVDLERNADKPNDPFMPYGATPGHGIEWARLICEWATSTYKDDEKVKPYIEAAENLYDRAIIDGWNSDGEAGICYTTDWKGKPVVHDRMHWTLMEAINTSAVLYRITGKKKYAEEYAMFLEYMEDKVHDKVNGSFYHQLDEHNKLLGTVWPGKSDIYHAFQAMFIPYINYQKSIARAIYDLNQR